MTQQTHNFTISVRSDHPFSDSSLTNGIRDWRKSILARVMIGSLAIVRQRELFDVFISFITPKTNRRKCQG